MSEKRSFFPFGGSSGGGGDSKAKGGRPAQMDVVDKFAGLPHPLNLPLFAVSKVMTVDTTNEEDKKKYVHEPERGKSDDIDLANLQLAGSAAAAAASNSSPPNSAGTAPIAAASSAASMFRPPPSATASPATSSAALEKYLSVGRKKQRVTINTVVSSSCRFTAVRWRRWLDARDRERDRFANAIAYARATAANAASNGVGVDEAAIEFDRIARDKWEADRTLEIEKLPQQLIAVACSNEHLILRWVDGGGVPVFRLVNWFVDPTKRIVSADFHPNGEWLCCLTLDGTLYLLPVRWLCAVNPGLGADGKINPFFAASDTARLRNRPTQLHGLNVPSLYTMITTAASASTASAAPTNTNAAAAAAPRSEFDSLPAPPPLASSYLMAIPNPATAGVVAATPIQAATPLSGSGSAPPLTPTAGTPRASVAVSTPIPGASIGTPPATLLTISPPAASVAVDAPFGSLYDLTEIRPPIVKGATAPAVSHCVWWSAFNGNDYAIISSYDGDVTFVSLRSPYTRTVCKIKTAILKIEILCHDDYAPSLAAAATPPTTPKRSPASSASGTPAPPVRGSPLRTGPTPIAGTLISSKPSPPAPRHHGSSSVSSLSSSASSFLDDSSEKSNADEDGNEFAADGSLRTQWKLALIHTLDGGVWTLLLEQRANQKRSAPAAITKLAGSAGSSVSSRASGPTHTYETCIESASNKRFKPLAIKRFALGARLSAQHFNRNAVIGVHDPTRARFELYAPLTIGEPNSIPLRSFLVASAKVYHYTDKFIFAVGVGREETTITVISTLLAQTSPSASAPAAAPGTSQSMLQELKLPNKQKMFGVMFFSHIRDSFLMWTADAAFECHFNSAADQTFAALLDAGKDDLCLKLLEVVESGSSATATGGGASGFSSSSSSLLAANSQWLSPSRINVPQLFERAAERAVQNRSYDRALKLYRLANVRGLALVSVFLVRGKIDLVIKLLKEYLVYAIPAVSASSSVAAASAALLSGVSLLDVLPSRLASLYPPLPRPTERQLVEASDLLFQCYVETLSRRAMESMLQTAPPHHHTATLVLEDEFCEFIDKNNYYSTDKALARLLEFSIPTTSFSFVLRVAHKRQQMNKCLELIARHGPYHITGNDVGFLINRNYSHLLLQTGAGGHIFRALPHWQQLEIILLEMLPVSPIPMSKAELAARDSSVTVALSFALLKLIPTLDENSLVRLCKFVDPAASAGGISQIKGGGQSRVQLLELFITAMLRLAYIRNSAAATAPPAPAPASAANGKSDDKSAAAAAVEETPYDEKLLHATLTQYWGQYRTSLIIQRCMDWSNWRGAALVYEWAEQYSDAFECRLNAASDEHRAMTAAEAALNGQSPFAAASDLLAEEPAVAPAAEPNARDEKQPAAAHVSRSLAVRAAAVRRSTQWRTGVLRQTISRLSNGDSALEKSRPQTERARLLALLIAFWSESGFPLAELEQALIAAMPALGPALAILLFQPVANPLPAHGANASSRSIAAAAGSPPPLPAFSSRLYMAVTQYRLTQMAVSNGAGNHLSSVQRLWSEILVNITKDIHRRLFVQFSALHHPPSNHSAPPPAIMGSKAAAAAASAGSNGTAADTELIAFTCGHVFGRYYYSSELLPEFSQRVSALEPPIPITAKLINAEYANVLAPPQPQPQPAAGVGGSLPHAVAAAVVASVAANGPVIALSCPLCLYHTLTQQHLKMKPAAPAVASLVSAASHATSSNAVVDVSRSRQTAANQQLRTARSISSNQLPQSMGHGLHGGGHRL